jgi:predicted HTH domain antitoxin
MLAFDEAKALERSNAMGDVHTLEVPQDILDSSRLTLAELKVGIAVYLYSQGRLSIGKAREFAGMSLWEFRQLLALRRISPHYDEADLDEDMATLREMGRL